MGGSDNFAQRLAAKVARRLQLAKVRRQHFPRKPRRERKDNFQSGHLPGDEVSGLDEDGKHPLNFHASASRDEGEQRFSHTEAERLFKFFWRLKLRHLLGDGVSDEEGFDATSLIEVRLKRQNAQQRVGDFGQRFDSASAPGPYAGADIPDDRDLHFFEALGKARIEVRKVHQQRDDGFSLLRCRSECFECAEDFGNFRNNSADAHDGDFVQRHQQLHALGLHLPATHSKEVGLWTKCFEMSDDACSMLVSGNFSGHNKDIHAAELMPDADEVKPPRGDMQQSVLSSILTLLVLGKPHWRNLAVSFVFMAILGLTTGLLAFLMGPAIQFVLSGGEGGLGLLSRHWPAVVEFPKEKIAWLLPGIAVVAGAIKGLAYLGQFYFSGWFGGLMVSDLRRQFFLNALQLKPSQTSKLQLGDLLSRFSADISAVEAAATWTIASWLRDSIQVVVLLGVAFFLSWQLSLGLCLAVPLMVFPAIRWMRKLMARMRESQAGQGIVAAQVSQSLTTLRSLQAYGAEAFEQRRFEKSAAQTSKALTHAAWTRSKGPALMELLIAAVLAVVLAGVGRFAWLETEVLLSFVATLLLIYHPAKELGRLSQLAIPAAAALERISAVSPPKEEETKLPSQATPLKMEEGILFENVGFSWGERKVLEGLNLKIPHGGITALVGESGGGKSTVIHLLMGFEKAQGGRIFIGGLPQEELSLQEIRSQFALVTQEAMLFSGSILDNLLLVRPEASLAEVEQALKVAQLHEFVCQLPEGLGTRIGEKGLSLSGGQRQKLCLARALLSDAPVLVLDEATSNLDAESEREFQMALEGAWKNKTTLVVAHRIATIQKANQICVLEGGRIIESGTHAELLAFGGLYADYCAS